MYNSWICVNASQTHTQACRRLPQPCDSSTAVSVSLLIRHEGVCIQKCRARTASTQLWGAAGFVSRRQETLESGRDWRFKSQKSFGVRLEMKAQWSRNVRSETDKEENGERQVAAPRERAKRRCRRESWEWQEQRGRRPRAETESTGVNGVTLRCRSRAVCEWAP